MFTLSNLSSFGFLRKIPAVPDPSHFFKQSIAVLYVQNIDLSCACCFALASAGFGFDSMNSCSRSMNSCSWLQICKQCIQLFDCLQQDSAALSRGDALALRATSFCSHPPLRRWRHHLFSFLVVALLKATNRSPLRGYMANICLGRSLAFAPQNRRPVSPLLS
jgi:hypothetical protein